MKKFFYCFLLLLFVFTPVLMMAQGDPGSPGGSPLSGISLPPGAGGGSPGPGTPSSGAPSGTIQGAVGVIGTIVGLLIPIMIALGIVIFFYGLAMYLLKAGEEEGQRGARNLMIYGVVAVFVMVSIWGLVVMLRTTFGVGTETDIPLPKVPGVTLHY